MLLRQARRPPIFSEYHANASIIAKCLRCPSKNKQSSNLLTRTNTRKHLAGAYRNTMPPLMSTNETLRSTNPGSCSMMFVNSIFNRCLSILKDDVLVEDGGECAEALKVDDELSWYVQLSPRWPWMAVAITSDETAPYSARASPRRTNKRARCLNSLKAMLCNWEKRVICLCCGGCGMEWRVFSLSWVSVGTEYV